MNITIKGILVHKGEMVEKGTFSSRKVWVEIDQDQQYKQTLEVEVSQGKVNLFQPVPIGAEVVCEINLRGRRWTNKETGVESCYNTLSCWKASVNGKPVDAGAAPGTYTTHDASTGYAKQQGSGYTPNQYPANTGQQDDPNDLPFAKPRTHPSLP